MNKSVVSEHELAIRSSVSRVLSVKGITSEYPFVELDSASKHNQEFPRSNEIFIDFESKLLISVFHNTLVCYDYSESAMDEVDTYTAEVFKWAIGMSTDKKELDEQMHAHGIEGYTWAFFDNRVTHMLRTNPEHWNVINGHLEIRPEFKELYESIESKPRKKRKKKNDCTESSEDSQD